MNCSLCDCSLSASQNKGSSEDPLCNDCLKNVEASSVLENNDEICDAIEEENAKAEEVFHQKLVALNSGDTMVAAKTYLNRTEANQLQIYLVNAGIFASVENYALFGKSGHYYRIDVQEKDVERSLKLIKEYTQKNI